MLSIQSYFSEAGTFSQLFEVSANEVRKSALLLMDLLRSSTDEFNRETFCQIQQENRQINEEIATLLCQSFVTPLEWKDLEELSCALYRISKTIYKFCIRIHLSKSYLPIDFFDLQAKTMAEATSVVYEMVQQLWHQPHLSQIKEENDRLNSLQYEADRLDLEMLRDLYCGEYEMMQVVILRDLLELLQKVIDRCCDAGNVIFQIVLKNS